MPGYVEETGPRGSSTEGRKQRKARADARALFDVASAFGAAASGEDVPEYPEYIRKRPAGRQLSHAAKAKAEASGSFPFGR